jgi:hypothetical protein
VSHQQEFKGLPGIAKSGYLRTAICPFLSTFSLKVGDGRGIGFACIGESLTNGENVAVAVGDGEDVAVAVGDGEDVAVAAGDDGCPVALSLFVRFGICVTSIKRTTTPIIAITHGVLVLTVEGDGGCLV